MIDFPKEIDSLLRDHLVNAVPQAISIIDQEFNLVFANRAFEEMFGPWEGQKCHAVYKKRDSICPDCKWTQAFETRKPVVTEETGKDYHGRNIHYIKHTAPVFDSLGGVSFLIEMYTDITETEQIRREYQQLFDQVPCNILIINRDYRIVRANNRAREMLGDLEGRHCFKGLKGADHKCNECTARQTFLDSEMHTGYHVWHTRDGRTLHLHVITVPLRGTDGSFDAVMEMAVDVTQTLKLEDGLKFAHSFLETMVKTSMDGIFAVDNQDEVSILNPAARRMLGIDANHNVAAKSLAAMLPPGVFRKVKSGSKPIYLPDAVLTRTDGTKIPARLVGNRLAVNERPMGMAFSIQDLRELKSLEKAKLEAERLGAVGQTVAGLAHGIKNLTTALEGGLYMLNTGIQRGKADRLQKGLQQLDRNINRIGRFTKAFLSFAKGRKINAKFSNPADIAAEVVESFSTMAEELDIGLTFEQQKPIKPAAIDYESLHECLTNFVSNAFDACQSSLNGKMNVRVRVLEEKGVILYEVIDNGCGMTEEVKNKVFTTFFTTKGLSGTGLGLLTTKKIVQEHGGTIEVESEPDKGSTFRIRLPRNRLPNIDPEDLALKEEQVSHELS